MRYKRLVLILIPALWLGLAAAGDPTRKSLASQQADELVAAPAQSGVPMKKGKLLTWLKAGSYKKTFVGEPAVHPSTGPHGGNVRTYFNPILAQNLKDGKKEWDAGAAMVKELYFGSTTEIGGFAVMVKIDQESGTGAGGWLFYENFNVNGKAAFYGRGIPLCANCHGAGTDYLLSPFRP